MRILTIYIQKIDYGLSYNSEYITLWSIFPYYCIKNKIYTATDRGLYCYHQLFYYVSYDYKYLHTPVVTIEYLSGVFYIIHNHNNKLNRSFDEFLTMAS